MKNLFIALNLISVITYGRLYAQEEISLPEKTIILDTIYANDTKNVALFFPDPIRQGITGSENFIFTYNRDKGQYFGLLQATPGEDSNLLIISMNGSIYSYIVKYKEQLSKLNYFVPRTKSIGNEKPVVKNTEPNDSVGYKNVSRTVYYKKFSNFLLARTQKIGKIKKRSDGIVLRVENIVFDRSSLYFVIEIENSSSLDYDLNFLKFYTETKKQGKRKSIQKLEKQPVYTHQLPFKITGKEMKRMVFVLPKFSLADGKRLVIELNEQNGERNINLNVKKRFINNPN
ncbi:DUF4138 domain-containing protein [Christiangramia forsetii]|uniref:TraN-like secreted protein n=2 Tax=Christiangramia forsetii TaxID=411153 RepID=A0M139_CHRFK|nr:DUF4138 domain-containing protein [Christiangramia forsetii]GGG46134.1 hypothetical protein GCM10011532_32550 [Christiangramia forsetii]CAL66334.1 TraN-like secreted protein [Christiangramia forsetii KT0803]